MISRLKDMILIPLLKEQWQFKMNITLIAAISENNVIGKDGQIPWRIREDMVRFKELTINHPVIIGRKTYESLPQKFRPLPQRENIILSRNLRSNEDVHIARSVEEVLVLIDDRESYVIGGAEVYKAFLPLAHRMEITKVHENFDGDAYFPIIKWNEWLQIHEKRNKSASGIDYSFFSYIRKI